MVGGWHAGASPSDPLSRLVTNREPRSRPFAHTYTPPLAVRATLTWTWLRTKVELQIEFGDEIFLSSPFTARTGSIAAQVCTRVEPQLEPALQLLACACAACHAWSPCVGRESHALCPLMCAGSKLNIQPVHPERPDFFDFCLGLGSLVIYVVSQCGTSGRVPPSGVRNAPSSHFFDVFVSVCIIYNQNDYRRTPTRPFLPCVAQWSS